jgi:hypothetical protein
MGDSHSEILGSLGRVRRQDLFLVSQNLRTASGADKILCGYLRMFVQKERQAFLLT